MYRVLLFLYILYTSTTHTIKMASASRTRTVLLGAGAAAVSAGAIYYMLYHKKRRDAQVMSMYPVSLGFYELKVDTKSHQCQQWFDRGINWVAGFHREEAAYCFEQAIAKDPTCAMARWGLALCHGPDYNFAETSGFYQLAAKPAGYPSICIAYLSAQKAQALADQKRASMVPSHFALINALVLRYEWPTTPSTPKLQEVYRDRLRLISAEFPNDPIVQACYAEAIMCLSPWQLYEKTTEFSQKKIPNKFGQECAIALDRGLRNNPKHLWLCHLKVHLQEMGNVDDFDMDAANALRDMEENRHEIGHLLHMGTHLDIQKGDYQSAMYWNMKGYEADMKLWEAFPQRFFVYSGYLLHNLEFCCWAAMYGGNYAQASNAASLIDRRVSEKALRSSDRAPMRLEMYRATAIMVLVRFGKWGDIIALPFKTDEDLFLAHTLFLNYAKGIAHGARGDVENASQYVAQFERIRDRLRKDDRIKHNVSIVEAASIASAILEAEIAYRRKDFGIAFAAARKAVSLFDSLPYDEPHGWLISPRQTLAALLTEQESFEEAIEVYKEDLTQFPNNIWSLSGLKICFESLEMEEDLRALMLDLTVARQVSDCQIGASCACAVDNWNKNTQNKCCM